MRELIGLGNKEELGNWCRLFWSSRSSLNTPRIPHPFAVQYVGKEERSKIDNISFYLRKLEIKRAN